MLVIRVDLFKERLKSLLADFSFSLNENQKVALVVRKETAINTFKSHI